MPRCLPLIALLLLAGGCSASKSTRGGGIQGELKAAFARMNPRVAYVGVLEVRPNPDPEAESEYIVLATAGANTGVSIRMDNELFGVFIADSTLGHVKRVLDVFPSKRWHDWTIRFDTSPEGILEVAGGGETFNDAATHRVYNWSPNATHALLREYRAPGDTASGE